MNLKRRLLLYLVLALALGTWYFLARGGDRYCWLVFGPKGDTRLLVRMTGRELCLDRNGDGRFSGPGEVLGNADYISTNVVITDRDGKTSYVLKVFQLLEVPEMGRRLLIRAEVRRAQNFTQLADAGLGRFRWRAPEAHFNGPLTVQAQTILWKLPPDLALARGDSPTDLRVIIGTLDAATECWTTVLVQGTNSQSTFPTNVHPMVEVEYPPKVAGAQPSHVRYPLKEFC